MRAPDFSRPLAAGAGSPTWRSTGLGQIAGYKLPYLGLGDRLMLRAVAMLACRHVLAIDGLQRIRPARDPFILAVNHSTRRESVLVPSLLLLHRGGRLVHFLADWNFRLIPGVGLIYARAQVVTVTRKSARPRFLNALKPLYSHPLPTLERARNHLAAGRSIGIFPEGQVNRDPTRLLRGRRGTARLSLETGVPVVPMGIRFLGIDRDRPIPTNAPMEIHIGAPLHPPGPAPGPTQEPVSMRAVSAWHAIVMSEIARLSGRAWKGATGGADHD